MIKPLGFLFNEAAIILKIKNRQAQRVALFLLIVVCILVVPAFMWGLKEYQNYRFHQLNPNSPVGNQLAPAPEKN